MTLPEPFRGTAFNSVPNSENEIHGDEVARQYGFSGGLVPGVTVSAYLCEPGVRAWGREFLERGRASIVVKKPLYDRREFEVKLSERDARRYVGQLHDADGTLLAEGSVELPDDPGPPPVRRGDRRLDRSAPRPPASRETFERLMREGMGSIPANWTSEAELASYYRDPAAIPELLRQPEDGGQGYANMGFLLGTTNWHLAANVKLGPWLHLQTDSQCFAAVEPGAKLVVEGQVADLFERKGHSFVDVELAAFRRDDSAAVMRCRLRAIYKLRTGA